MSFKFGGVSRLPVALAFSLVLLFATGARAESVTELGFLSPVTEATMANTLAGPGLTVSGASFSGNHHQGGEFEGFAFLLGNDFDKGVILSTGRAQSVLGPNSSDKTSDRMWLFHSHDDDLGGRVYDPAKLSFTAVPQFDVLLLDFVFGSEEYTEFVGDSYNDVARILVNGSNCALTPAGDEVRVNNINAASANNSALYINNDLDDGGASFHTEMDGFTRRMTCRVPVTPGLPVSVTVGTADIYDNRLNSWILFRARSMRSEPANDFGDAPDSYKTLLASDGARHTIVEGVRLGGGVISGDSDGFRDGVDNSAGNALDDQDDALSSVPVINSGSASYSVSLTATSINAKASTVIGWVDFDRDGIFQSDEASAPVSVPGGSYERPITLNWSNIGGSGPNIATGGQTYMRLRIANAGLHAGKSGGHLASGEVEDYRVVISDGRAPVAQQILRHNPTAAVTNLDAVTFRVSFSEPVSNVGNADFVASGGSATVQSVVQVTESIYDVTVNGIASFNGTVALTLSAASDIVDSQGNGLGSFTAGTAQTYTLDNRAPGIVIQGVPTLINGPFTATFQFDEPVAGFVAGDINAGNASVSGFTVVDGDTYTALITPLLQGTFTLNVNAGAATDAAGNTSTAAAPKSGSYDGTAPTVLLQNVPALSSGAFTATIQFSESVSGFTVADIAAGNASLSGFTAVDADTYTVLVSPQTDGTFTLNVSAGVAVDNAGNGNAAATQASGQFDGTAPSLAISNVPADTNGAFVATIQFSEAVSGFAVSDISVSNAALSSFTAVDADTYTVQVSPVTDGTFTLNVGAGVATDAAGNGNTAATQVSGRYDSTAPAAVINGVPSQVAGPFTATIQFSESVSGFVAGDISVTNATLSGFTALDADTYTVLVTPTAEGAFSLGLEAGVAADAAGNGNAAVSAVAGTYDGTAPSVTIESVPGYTSGPFTALIQFSEPVTGFEIGDISVTNGSLSAFTAMDADTYTVLVTPASEGAFSLGIAGNVATDAAGNGNTAAATASGAYDVGAPAVTIDGVPSSANAPFTATIQFSEGVNGFAIGDIAVTNASLSTFVALDADTYTVLVTPTAEGAFSLGIAADVAADAAGNGNTAASSATGIFDVTSPVVVIDGVPENANASFTVTIRFSEAVGGFSVGDIDTSNVTLSGFTAVDAATYTVLVTPTAEGAFSLGIDADVAADAAGNGNTAASVAGGAYDASAPSVSIEGVPNDANAPFAVTIQFSEAVNGFTVDDIDTSNVTLSGFTSVDGATYTVLVTPAAEGAFSLAIAADVAADAAGNGNTAASVAGGTYDASAPMVSIEGVPSDANAPFTITIRFSEAVSGFTVDDIDTSNVTLSGFTSVDGATYTVLVTPTAEGAFSLGIDAGVATDAAGNGNTAASAAGGEYDSSAPTVSLAGVPSDTNAAFTVTIAFSEAVSGFAASDISTSNATLTNFVAIDAATYSVLVTPASEGAFSLGVAAGVAVDAAGNGNIAADGATGLYDITAPATPALTAVSSDTGTPGDGITSDRSLVLSGSGEPGSTVDVFINGDLAGSATVSVPGIWTLDYSATELADGTYAVTARAADNAGNQSPLSPAFSLRIDTLAPAAPVLTGISDDTGVSGADGVTSDRTLLISGTAEAGAAIEVLVDGVVAGSTSADGDGNWVFDYRATELSDGSYSIAARAGDAAGNNSPLSAPLAISIDATGPALPAIVAISDDTGESANDGITSDASLVISGTGEPGATLTLFLDGAEIAAVTVTDTGSWTVDYSATPLADGSYALTAQQTDRAGNISDPSPALSLVVDSQAPDAPTLAQLGLTLEDNTPTLSGSAEAGARVTVTLGSGEVLETMANGDGDWSVTATVSVPEGELSVQVVAIDAAGNASTPLNASVFIDIRISEANSSVSVMPGMLPADGVATASVNVIVRDTLNQPQSGLALAVVSDLGIVGSVTDAGGGSYTAILTAPLISGLGTVVVTSGGERVGEQHVLFMPADSDSDGLSNDDEDSNGDQDPTNDDLDGDGTPNYLDDDDDGDGKSTADEDVNGDGNPFNDDSDGDGIPDFLDADDDSSDGTNDSDGDGVADTVECSTGLPCPDSDGDGLPDYMDGDDDNDGIPTAVEGGSRDSDGDGVPDYLDPDDDNDGLLTRNEDGDSDGDGDPSTNPGPDQDNDGIPAYLDPNDSSPGVGDTDGDGIGDDVECQAGGRCEDSDGDGRPDFNDPDDDNDSILTRDEDVNEDGDPSNDDTDGDGIPDYLDRDDDNDGIDTIDEGTGDSDGDGIPDYLDRDNSGAIDGSGDSDGDGLSDAFECPTDIPCRDSDGDGVPDYMDEDDDNDGVLTIDEDVNLDGHPSNDDVDGDGTPNYLDTDDDGDGVDTRLEGTGDSDGDGIPDHLDPSAGDSDGDGLGDGVECDSGIPCPDLDGDGVPDFMDPDDDGDGVPTIDEDLNGDGDPRNDDTDGDGIPDYRDSDDDDDGVDTAFEGTGDTDGDGIPDYLDRDNSGAIDGSGDSDGDGVSDSQECPTGVPCRDSDGDGLADYLDADDDNDGIDTRDEDPNEDGDRLNDDTDQDGTPNYLDADDDGDGLDTRVEGDGDSDGDGIPDYLDPSAGDSDGDGVGDGLECPRGIPCRDSDGDGIADYLDDDDDNDGIPTREEDVNGNGDPSDDDTDGDGIPNYRDSDDDGDGLPTLLEGSGDSDGDRIPDHLDGDSSNAASTADGSGDSDGDGLSDRQECRSGPPCPDTDGDGIPDYLDRQAGPTEGKVHTALNSAGASGWLLGLAMLLAGLRRTTPLLGLLLLSSGLARASTEPVTLYAGGGLGLSWLDPGTGESAYDLADDTDSGWQLLAGWRLLDSVSLEAFYADLGAAQLEHRVTNTPVDLDYVAYGGLLNWYPGQTTWAGGGKRNWFLQAGMSSLSNDSDAPVDKERGAQVTLGAGLDFHLSKPKRWVARFSLQSHNVDAAFLSINLIRAFPGKRPPAEPEPQPQPMAEPAPPAPVAEPAPQPAPQPVSDQDGDGVADDADLCPGTPTGVVVNASGCSPLDITLEGLTFSSGSAAIDPSSHEVLDRVVAALQQFPSARVEIAAHTDSIGSEAFNQALSEQRANEVRVYLIEQGVAPERLTSRGYGESRPKADNDSASGRAANRRVEVRLLSD